MKPMPGAIVSQVGRLVSTVNNVPPLHLLASIGFVLVALTLATPFAFEALGDNAFMALTMSAGLLTIVATPLAARTPTYRALRRVATIVNKPPDIDRKSTRLN